MRRTTTRAAAGGIAAAVVGGCWRRRGGTGGVVRARPASWLMGAGRPSTHSSVMDTQRRHQHQLSRVYVALGSNLGDRVGNLRRAVAALNEEGVGTVETTSGLYESKAQYVTEQPDFVNALCRLRTSLDPPALLRELKRLERQLGRVPSIRYGPRAVDLDIVLWEEEEQGLLALELPGAGGSKEGDGWLTIPHPRLAEREFVLRPLQELLAGSTFEGAAALRHPKTGQTVGEMLAACERQRPADAPPLVRVVALPSSSSSPSGDSSRLLPLDADAPARASPTCVMGVLNVTPDSFSDGGADRGEVEAAVGRALRMVEAGAGVIDVGGESTRPGAAEVAAEEEARRVVPVIEGIRRRAGGDGVVISVDTRRAAVARAAVEAGADLVNDVSGGAFDPAMLPTVAALRVPYCLMHMRGTPQTMTSLAHYSPDPVADVTAELRRQVAAAEAAGVRRWDLVVDPGIGFAKDLEHNLAVLRGLRRLREGLGRLPVLVGVSRKRFIGTICNEPEPARRDLGTSVANALAIAEGAAAIRVHNVPAAVQTARMADAIARHARS